MTKPSPYVQFDGMTWPHPNDPAEVEWRLRYGTLSRDINMTAASYVEAYRHLIRMDRRTREKRIAELRKAAKK